MFKSICHKCGRKIFNGIPSGEDVESFIEKMRQKGYIIGYNTKSVGSFGNIHEVKIKPICSICNKKSSDIKYTKETKKATRKILPVLKKVFVCPICEKESEFGYNTKIFKCSGKTEMIDHIRTHSLKDIQNIISF